MSKRPLSVVLVGWLFIAAGVVGIVHHTGEIDSTGPLEQGMLWVLFVRLLVIVGGVFLLRGANWARWLVVAWLAWHVGLSAFHSPSEAAAHAVLLAAIAVVLFRQPTSTYFRPRRDLTRADSADIRPGRPAV